MFFRAGARLLKVTTSQRKVLGSNVYHTNALIPLSIHLCCASCGANALLGLLNFRVRLAFVTG